MVLLFCPKCSIDVEPVTELKSNQNTARCPNCDTFIKNIPYEKPKFYVGKYKGKAIEEIDDISYLRWAFDNMKLNTRTKDAIRSRINHLEFLAK